MSAYAKFKAQFKRYVILCLTLIVASCFIDHEAVSKNVTLKGRAFVVDGDTLVIKDQHIRLFGMDAFEHHQTCGRYACGRVATRTLSQMAQGKIVSCHVRDHDSYGRLVSQCFDAKGRDLGREMVALGLAVDYRGFSDIYMDVESQAKREKRGAWAYPFISPQDFRARH